MQADIQIAERQFTELDFVRLNRLSASGAAAELAEVLAAADVVHGPDIGSSVVTMYSRVEIEDTQAQARRVVAVCYPQDAEPARGFISVLSPLGAGLIGMREGDTVRWNTPAGAWEARVLSVLFQPEASGDYLT